MSQYGSLSKNILWSMRNEIEKKSHKCILLSKVPLNVPSLNEHAMATQFHSESFLSVPSTHLFYISLSKA